MQLIKFYQVQLTEMTLNMSKNVHNLTFNVSELIINFPLCSYSNVCVFVCRARWRGENRTIFNTPNPRLMNVSLLDSKLLHGGNLERRASRGSVRGAPSRHASMTSLRPANSPTGNSIVMTSSASARVHASGNAANHPPNTTTTTTVTSTQWPPKLRGDPLAGEDHNARLYFLYISLFAKKIIYISFPTICN